MTEVIQPRAALEILADASSISGDSLVNVGTPGSSQISVIFHDSINFIATVTTKYKHNFSTGDSVEISGIDDNSYNGTFAIVAIDDFNFRYNLTGINLTSPVGGANALAAISTGGSGEFFDNEYWRSDDFGGPNLMTWNGSAWLSNPAAANNQGALIPINFGPNVGWQIGFTATSVDLTINLRQRQSGNFNVTVGDTEGQIGSASFSAAPGSVNNVNVPLTFRGFSLTQIEITAPFDPSHESWSIDAMTFNDVSEGAGGSGSDEVSDPGFPLTANQAEYFDDTWWGSDEENGTDLLLWTGRSWARNSAANTNVGRLVPVGGWNLNFVALVHMEVIVDLLERPPGPMTVSLNNINGAIGTVTINAVAGENTVIVPLGFFGTALTDVEVIAPPDPSNAGWLIRSIDFDGVISG